MSSDITFTNYQVKINAVKGTYTKDTMPMFQPYDNTFANSNNTLISTGRNLVDVTIPKLNDSSFVTFMENITLPKGKYDFLFTSDTKGNDTFNISIDDLLLSGNAVFNKRGSFTLDKTMTGALTGWNNVAQTNVKLCIWYGWDEKHTSFEPYKQDTITTIGSLGEFDYILPQSNQKVIQTSQVVTLNGSESWTLYSGNMVTNAIDSNALEGVSAIPNNSQFTIDVQGGSYRLCVITNNAYTVETWRQYLQQNQIQLVYKQATPTIINDGPIPNGMAVYNGGLQIQQSDGLPYTITKQYNLSQKAQILANIEVDREQQDQLNELRSKAAAKSNLGWEDVWEGTLTLNNPDFTIEQSLADKLKDKNTIYAFSFTDSSGAPEDYGSYGIVYASYQITGSTLTLTGNGIILQNTYEPYFIRIWLEGNTLHSRYANGMGEGEVLLLTAIRKLTLK